MVRFQTNLDFSIIFTYQFWFIDFWSALLTSSGIILQMTWDKQAMIWVFITVFAIQLSLVVVPERFAPLRRRFEMTGRSDRWGNCFKNMKKCLYKSFDKELLKYENKRTTVWASIGFQKREIRKGYLDNHQELRKSCKHPRCNTGSCPCF